MKNSPRIAVVGAGAVGGYLGARLASTGYEPWFLARGDRLAALRRHGVRVVSATSACSVSKVQASSSPDEIGRVDYLFLCVKTCQLPAAVDGLLPMLGEKSVVVPIQNGVEAPQQVAAKVGRERVLPGTVKVVADVMDSGEIRHVGPPGIVACAEWDNSVSDRVTRLHEILRRALGTSPVVPDVWGAIWSKFVLVAPIGSLGAATGGATIGELRSRPGLRRMLLAGMREVYELGCAQGVGLPEGILEQAAEVVDRQPSELTTSLQRDILAGRPSELQAWTGAVVRLAAQVGQPVPIHDLLYELLAAREAIATRQAKVEQG